MNSSLNRRVGLILFSVLGITSLIFLIVVLNAYRTDLKDEMSRVSHDFNEVLRKVLENAMLKRDLEGLQTIVSGMADQPAIREVHILNRQGEVRFSSEKDKLYKPYSVSLEELCQHCSGPIDTESAIVPIETRYVSDVLRSVNMVSNKPRCNVCHGPTDSNPINGILIVDYDASSIRSRSVSSLWALVTAGLVTIGLTLTAIWFFMRHYILTPVEKLNTTSKALALGNLDARVNDIGEGEISELGHTINSMARNLQASINKISESESYLQQLIDADPDGIRVIDNNYRVVKYNRAYQAMVGHIPDTCCYQSSHSRDIPCVPTMVTCPLYEIRKSDQPVKTLQTFVDSRGKKIATQVYSAPIRTQDGELQIIQSIRDMRNDIKVSQEHRLVALGQLAAGVGHEILNPLNSIRLALKSTLQQLEYGSNDLETAVEYLKLVDGQIDRCIDVTNRLKQLSALPDQRDQLVNLNISITETCSLLAYEAEKRHIELKLELKDGLPRIYASESNIRTVILNLVQNAYHAMPDGGELCIRTSENAETHTVSMEYIDSGVGIDEADIPVLMNPFFSQRASGEPGMGLGLPICLAIIEQHGGSLKMVSNKVEKPGARILVTFDIAQ